MSNLFDFAARLRWVPFLMAAFCWAGCSTAHTRSRVLLPEAKINEHPARFILDTGAKFTIITSEEAKFVNLQRMVTMPGAVTSKGHMEFSLSEPARFTLGDNDFTAPLVIGEMPDNVVSEKTAGVVGWPEIIHNILVFDGPNRKITVVKTLPPEVAGWLKLRIRNTGQLTLETPLSNGKSGVLLVDTGSYFGIGLPAEQWKNWHAAHANTPTASLAYYTPGVGRVVTTEAWADAVSLGALQLTDVPVHEANAAEAQVSATNYAGTLGLYALTRMKMVLDAGHSTAYIQPQPAPGPYYSAFNRPGIADETANNPNGSDWILEGPLNIDADNLRQFSSDMLADFGERKLYGGDFSGAVEEFAKALKVYPKNINALRSRALAHELENDFTAATADYSLIIDLCPPAPNPDRLIFQGRIQELKGNPDAAVAAYTQAIALDSQKTEAYLYRGVDRQIQGNLYDALDDYNKAIQYSDETNAVPVLYGEMLRRWIGNPRQNLTATVTKWEDGWYKNTGNYLDESLSEAAYLASVGTNTLSRIFQCQTYYVIGLNHMTKGDLAGARANWEKCVATPFTSLNEYRMASAGLAQLHAMGK